MRIQPGTSYPLGATWDGAGVNFALFSENATSVVLCLFDEDGAEQARVPVTTWGTASIPRSSSSIPTRGPSTARSSGATRSSGMWSGIPTPT